MAYEFLILIVGLVFLVKFSNLAVKHAVRFSHLSGINQMTVGFVIIAVSTSLPEMMIAVISSLKNEGILSLGNVVGSSVSNVALVLGVMSLFGFAMKKRDVKEVQWTLLISILLAFAVLVLGRVDIGYGIFSLIIFYVATKTIFKHGLRVTDRHRGVKTIEMVKSLLLLILSVFVVVISANVVVDYAVLLAGIAGIATSAIGATIISIGTTMPEMSVNLAALRKKNIELAVGDSVGSVLTNLALVLGVGSLINPISYGPVVFTGLVSLILIGLFFMYLSARIKFGIREGVALLSVFAAYLALMIYVGSL